MRKAFKKDVLAQALEIPLRAAEHYRTSTNGAKRSGGDISAQRCTGAVGIVDLRDGTLLKEPNGVKERSTVEAPASKKKKGTKRT